jgi:predicted DNA-binding transcriptional regulator AlpA
MSEDKQLLRIKEFLTAYSVGRTSLYREVKAGRLKLRKFGTASRISRADAEAWAAGLPVAKAPVS